MNHPKLATFGSVSGLILRAPFAITIFSSYFAISSSSSASSNLLTFPNCSGTTYFVGDGDCDDMNNNMECAYDGGDCCSCSCVSTTSYTCGSNDFDCLDPEAGVPMRGCEVVRIEPPQVSPCVTSTPQNWVVESGADAESLATSIFCSGGIFQVEWRGFISVNRTFYVIDGTVLDVVGGSGSVADGGGTTQLFFASNGTLRVSDVHVTNGTGAHGGAIFAAQESEVTLSRVKFSSNIADYFGGAVHLDNSSLELANSTTFTGNGARFGGAIYMAKGSNLMQHVKGGEIYRFIDNNATDGGALYVSGASSVALYTPKDATTTSTSATSPLEYSLSAVGATSAKTYFIKNNVECSGGAVYIDGGSTYYWQGQITFEGNTAEYGGALFLGDLNNIDWRGVTVFTQNSARVDGGAFASAANNPYVSVILDGPVSFSNNTCERSGGALALFGDMGFFLAVAAEFSGNSAALSGGAIYLSEAASGHDFVGARFTENQAQNGGAVLAAGCGTDQKTDSSGKATYFPTKFSGCTFIGNSALEAGGAIEIAVGRAHVETSEFVGNTASVGGAVRLFGTAVLLNSSFSENKSVEGGGSAISNIGIISEMAGLSFSANRFLCDDEEYVDFSEGFRVEATCQGCDTTCQGCLVEDNNSVPSCAVMFEHAHSENGTATIEGVIVDRGYWRANTRSEKVMPCFNADACLGGLTGDPGYCNDGYEGPYCSVCSANYTATLAFTCSQCSDGNLAVVVVILAISFLAALAFVWNMVSIHQENPTLGVVVRVEKVLPLQSLKIIVVVWQIVTQFGSAAQVIYPESYQRLVSVVAFLVNFDIGWMLSAGCIMEVDFCDGLLMATVGPMAVIALLGTTYTVAIHRNRGSEVAVCAVRRKHLGAIVLLTFFIYSAVSSVVFRTFACDKLDDENVYLRADYRIKCDSPRYEAFKIYAGLMILVYPVGIPLFYTIILVRENRLLMQGFDRDPRRYDSTSTLRKPYRPSVFYYEVVECSRRILLTGVVVFIYPDSAAQIAVTTLIAFTFVLVSEGLRPYASRWDAWMSRAGHVIVFLSVYVALLLKVDISNESQRDHNIFAGILVAGHGVMILLVIMETVAILYSMRNQERSLPISRSSVEGIDYNVSPAGVIDERRGERAVTNATGTRTGGLLRTAGTGGQAAPDPAPVAFAKVDNVDKV